jgi:hypothetical protein
MITGSEAVAKYTLFGLCGLSGGQKAEEKCKCLESSHGAAGMSLGAPSSAARHVTATTLAGIESRGAGSRRLAEVVRLLRNGNESSRTPEPKGLKP